jgi:Outer membrane protein beta-barrel domain
MYPAIRRSVLFPTLCRSAFVALFAGAAALSLNAQQSPATPHSLVPLNAPISIKNTLAAPLDITSSSSSSDSSNSSDDLSFTSNTGLEETATAEGFNFGGRSDQPPPRRHYGHPNYADSRTNADGSEKYTFVVGGGFTVPVGGTDNYWTPRWKFQAGGGRNFNKNFGVLVQFDWDDFGFQTHTLNTLLAIYNSLGATDQSGNPLTVLGGTAHDWSFTLNPIYNFYTGDSLGAYAVVGMGFYHKTANFTIPGVAQYCDPFYGCYLISANQTIDKYTSNAFGVNGGFGITYKASKFAGERFFAEVRYVWTDNSPRPFDISGDTAYFNAFPQNSARTTYIPVTFGIRF